MSSVIQNVLLVEDSFHDMELTLAALADFHLRNQIIVVPGGEDALDYLYRRGGYHNRVEGNPMLMLLDLKMPKVSGIDVLKTMKADRDLSTIPVIMLASSADAPELMQCHALGVHAHIVKPVEFGAFVKAVHEVGL